jgi:hypothetical protein
MFGQIRLGSVELRSRPICGDVAPPRPGTPCSTRVARKPVLVSRVETDAESVLEHRGDDPRQQGRREFEAGVGVDLN